ncbi:hypothetical protein HWC07_gp088 [Pantoea phage vB_PagM_LIET2]|uniref:Uncharacterized protein n=1 Tax=Pantoea phage vB_PagM_LIET2 TaxID=2508071 RepID=A0A411AW98_9CAUD|nr:hypothetical protein HWC07_gp088 [Pantoea phage vB_PagM_LIET2]QAX92340.1 hypothetical protein LIET2_gp088 [Pantoea phage vB_PagM_LIET2]
MVYLARHSGRALHGVRSEGKPGNPGRPFPAEFLNGRSGIFEG